MKGRKCLIIVLVLGMLIEPGIDSSFAETATLCSVITGYVLERPIVEIQEEQKEEMATRKDFQETLYSQIEKNPQPLYDTEIEENTQNNTTVYTITEKL